MKNPKNCFVIVRYQCWWWKHFFAIRRKLHLWLILFLNSYYYPVTIQSDTTLTYIILISLWPNQISHLKAFALGKIRLFYPLLSSLSYATSSPSSRSSFGLWLFSHISPLWQQLHTSVQLRFNLFYDIGICWSNISLSHSHTLPNGLQSQKLAAK